MSTKTGPQRPPAPPSPPRGPKDTGMNIPSKKNTNPGAR